MTALPRFLGAKLELAAEPKVGLRPSLELGPEPTDERFSARTRFLVKER